MKCPVCDTEYEKTQNYCKVEKCNWEFKRFFGGISEEVQESEKKRLKLARDNYNTNFESENINLNTNYENSAEFYYKSGLNYYSSVLYDIQKCELAIKHYEKAIKLYPNDEYYTYLYKKTLSSCYDQLAWYYFENQKFDLCIEKAK